MLSSNKKNEDYQNLVDLFKDAYADLTRTVKDLPDFSEILDNLLDVIELTEIEEMNSNKKFEQLDWSLADSWILIGGKALERGFTVEGLTITYMPRKIGIGNVDSLQQRCRFFGYKRKYIDYCRVFLPITSRTAFINYVDHEEHMRSELEEYNKENQLMGDWIRNFILNSNLKLTRSNVVPDSPQSGNYSDSFCYQQNEPDQYRSMLTNTITDRLVENISFVNHNKYPNIKTNENHILLEEFYECFLKDYIMALPNQDVGKFLGVIIQIKEAIKNNALEECTIYHLCYDDSRIKDYAIENGKIKQIFSGRNKSDADKYPGDRKIVDENNVTIQIHRLFHSNNEGSFPVITIWIPSRLENNWFVLEMKK